MEDENLMEEEKKISFIKKGMKFKNKRFGDRVFVTDVDVEDGVTVVEFQTGIELDKLPEEIFLKNYTRI